MLYGRTQLLPGRRGEKHHADTRTAAESTNNALLSRARAGYPKPISKYVGTWRGSETGEGGGSACLCDRFSRCGGCWPFKNSWRFALYIEQATLSISDSYRPLQHHGLSCMTFSAYYELMHVLRAKPDFFLRRLSLCLPCLRLLCFWSVVASAASCVANASFLRWTGGWPPQWPQREREENVAEAVAEAASPASKRVKVRQCHDIESWSGKEAPALKNGLRSRVSCSPLSVLPLYDQNERCRPQSCSVRACIIPGTCCVAMWAWLRVSCE